MPVGGPVKRQVGLSSHWSFKCGCNNLVKSIAGRSTDRIGIPNGGFERRRFRRQTAAMRRRRPCAHSNVSDPKAYRGSGHRPLSLVLRAGSRRNGQRLLGPCRRASGISEARCPQAHPSTSGRRGRLPRHVSRRGAHRFADHPPKRLQRVRFRGGRGRVLHRDGVPGGRAFVASSPSRDGHRRAATVISARRAYGADHRAGV